MQTKQERAAYYKAYRAANREKLAAAKKAWYDNNRGEVLARVKVYQAARPEKTAAHKRKYAANHPNERLALWHKQRAKKAGAKIVNPKAILAWFKGWKTEAPVACHYCKAVAPGTDMEIDHVIPMSKGGDHDLPNLVVCCKSCNGSKYNKLPAEWQAKYSQ